MVCRLLIFSRLRCRDVDNVTSGVCWVCRRRFGVTSAESIPAVVDLELHLLDEDEPDVDEPFRSFVEQCM